MITAKPARPQESAKHRPTLAIITQTNRQTNNQTDWRWLTLSAWVECLHTSVYLFICLSVCPQHNSKTNNSNVFKLGIGNDLGIFQKWFGVKSSKVKVTGSISAFFTLITITPMLLHIWLETAIRRGFELYECVLRCCLRWQFSVIEHSYFKFSLWLLDKISSVASLGLVLPWLCKTVECRYA